MRKQVYLFIGLWVAVLFLNIPNVHASLKFSVFGAGNLSNLKDSAAATTVTNSAKLNFGGGAQFEIMFGQVVGLEFGGIYLGRKFSQTDSTVPITLESTYTYVQIPLQLRFWLGRFVTLGVGGYYAIPVGDIKFSALGIEGTSTYAGAGLKTSDYGLLGSLGFNIPLGPAVGLMVEGRYAMGLQDLNVTANPAGTVKWSDIQFLAGLRFGMMSK
jgi:hypothetical protein